MREFRSPGAFAAHLRGIGSWIDDAEHRGLERAATLIEGEAKATIGTYQGGSGPFGAWPQLAESTQRDRVSKGYTPNNPLLRSGELRDSIKHSVGDRSARIGSDMEIAVFQEMGTSRIPARSFLGASAFRKGEEVAKIIGRSMAMTIAGKSGI